MPEHVWSGVTPQTPKVSDTVGASVATPTALTASYVASPAVDVGGYAEVDWSILVTNAGTGPVTRVDAQWEFATTAAPVDADWSPLQTEVVAAGVSTPSSYEVQQPIAGAVPYSKAWTTKARGRWMRIKVKAGAGTATSSAIALSALRRVTS